MKKEESKLNLRKVFTNDESNIIIKENYNPLKANKIEREGLQMKEIEKELNLKERIIIKVFSKTFNKITNLVRINTFNNMIK